MRWSLTIFLILCQGVARSDDGLKVLLGPDPKVDILSDEYEAGPFLMYDCEAKHWVCVLKPIFDDCVKRRSRELREGQVRVSCAHFGGFPNKISCFQRQLFLVGQDHGTRFCLNPHWKQKEIRW